MNAIDICNMALKAIGNTRSISSFTEASAEADACASSYDITRELLLKSYPWKFATKTIELTEVTAEEDDKYAYVYEYPSDCMRVIRIGVESDCGEPVHNPFDVHMSDSATSQVKRIYTDVEDAKATYIYDVQDVTAMPPEFRKALALMLAVDIAPAMSSDAKLTAVVENRAGMAVDNAKRMSFLEQRIPQPTTNRYVDARR